AESDRRLRHHDAESSRHQAGVYRRNPGQWAAQLGLADAGDRGRAGMVALPRGFARSDCRLAQAALLRQLQRQDRQVRRLTRSRLVPPPLWGRAREGRAWRISIAFAALASPLLIHAGASALLVPSVRAHIPTRPQDLACGRTPVSRCAARGGRRAALSVLALLACLLFTGAVRADALDDTLAKFLDDKFPQTEKAIGELAAEAPPQAAAILEALGENRLLFDRADHIVAYKTTAGAVINAKTGQPIASADAFKKVRVNNAIRSAIEGSMGSLTLANPDPQKRIAAAQDVFKTRDAKALPALEAQLAKESDPRVAEALRLAQAAIVAVSDNVSSPDRLAAIGVLKARGDQDAQSLIDQLLQKTTDPVVKSAAETALSSIHTRLAIWGAAQDLWYGLSASSVLLLAAIGLAITFGVMGVINMAHGEMVMLGAYATYVVQLLLPPSLQNWSLAFAIPLAFLVAAIVGVAIERLIIRYLYTRPLETLLATWGVSLILQQAVRS